jgi:hypothetical protein
MYCNTSCVVLGTTDNDINTKRSQVLKAIPFMNGRTPGKKPVFHLVNVLNNLITGKHT